MSKNFCAMDTACSWLTSIHPEGVASRCASFFVAIFHIRIMGPRIIVYKHFEDIVPE
ncbi:MAG: hypothetical protein FGF48_10235 [Candidatus Brockarchaeota archaeon]|nr:hypothetical protein [Candidatus Brockarchaeota archaeon]